MPCYDDRDRQEGIDNDISLELLTVLLCAVLGASVEGATLKREIATHWCTLHERVDRAAANEHALRLEINLPYERGRDARDAISRAQQELLQYERHALKSLEIGGFVPKKYREGLHGKGR